LLVESGAVNRSKEGTVPAAASFEMAVGRDIPLVQDMDADMSVPRLDAQKALLDFQSCTPAEEMIDASAEDADVASDN
jgi:hypothetical protein